MGKGSYYQGFILSQGEGCGEDVEGNGSKQVKGTVNHQLQKLRATWACILSNRNTFYTLRGGRTTVGFNAPGAFLVLSFVFVCLFFFFFFTPTSPIL